MNELDKIRQEAEAAIKAGSKPKDLDETFDLLKSCVSLAWRVPRLCDALELAMYKYKHLLANPLILGPNGTKAEIANFEDPIDKILEGKERK